MSNDVSALSHRAKLSIALSVVGVVTDIRPLPYLVTTVPRSWRRIIGFQTIDALAFPPMSFTISPIRVAFLPQCYSYSSRFGVQTTLELIF